MRVRIAQHKGISFRTNLPMLTPNYSAIREHSIKEDHPIKEDDFSLLASCQNFDLKILESIYILDQKPNLNDHQSSVDLFILK